MTPVMSEEMMHAWVSHNIEEVGVLEHVLPDLFAAASTSVTPA